MSDHKFAAALAGVVSSVLIVTGVAYSQTSPTAAAVERGRATFHQFCATCHGERGDAKGRAASALVPPAADLQHLEKRYGAFPTVQVRSVIMGTDQRTAHTPAMNTWGAMLLAESNGNDAAAASRVDDLVAFIASVQQK